MHGVVPLQVQDLLFHFVELHEIAVGHFYSLWTYLRTIIHLPDILGVSRVHGNDSLKIQNNEKKIMRMYLSEFKYKKTG